MEEINTSLSTDSNLYHYRCGGLGCLTESGSIVYIRFLGVIVNTPAPDYPFERMRIGRKKETGKGPFEPSQASLSLVSVSLRVVFLRMFTYLSY